MSLRRWFNWVVVLMCLLGTGVFCGTAQAAEPVRIAVLAIRSKPQTLKQWQPLAAALKAAIPERDFEVQVYTLRELDEVVASRTVDFVLTNPGHYVLLSERSNLQAALATLLASENGQETAAFGGVVFTLADQKDVSSLADILGKTVAAVDQESMGGYQAQAYELLQVGVRVQQDNDVTFIGGSHDMVVETVLNHRAQVGFVRSGVLEAMSRDGKLDLNRVRILNAQNLSAFPVKSSTALYPEWPFSYLGHVDKNLARQVVAALFLIAPNSYTARAIGINGFAVPADYSPVTDMMRELRLPPFDVVPAFTWRDVLARYQWPLAGATVALVLILLLGLRLWLTGKRLRAEQTQVLAQQAALAENELRWKLAVQATGGGVWDWNLYTNKLYRSDEMLRMLGFTPGQMDDTPDAWASLLHPDDREHSLSMVQDCLDGRSNFYVCEHRVMCKDGRYKWLLARGQVVSRGPDGEPLRMIGIDAEITERKAAEGKLQLAASVFNAAREGIFFTDAEGNFIEVNQAFTTITGYERADVIGKNPRLMSSGQQNDAFFEAMFAELQAKDHWCGEIWNRRKNGEQYLELVTVTAVRDAKRQLMHFVAMFSDITQIREHQKQLERIAHFDALTNLPNRALLADRMHQAMVQAQRRGQLLAVAYLDLDGFKLINDKYGHDAGDQLLIAVSSAMKQVLREGDTLARIGGDEFVAVLTDFVDTHDCTATLQRVLLAAAQLVHLGGFDLQVSASLGVTFYPQADEVDADQLMRQADQAMYQAKLAGKNRFHVFDTANDRQTRGAHERIDEMVAALDRHEFRLFYQPKVNLRTGQVVGAEALIRWQHPEKGLLSPALFLPVIENHTFSISLGDWVIEAALDQMAQWRVDGLVLPVSVNVSARQLQCEDFVDKLRLALDLHPTVAPSLLTLEVLETSVIDDLASTGQLIAEAARLGVSFSLDDFGTGYSSLTYLKHLPVREIKIDQSFVRDMLDDDDDLAILQGVISLAHAFKREVIAEGMETMAHGVRLLQLGCELAQGYGIARPMPEQDIPNWVATWKPDPAWQASIHLEHHLSQKFAEIL